MNKKIIKTALKKFRILSKKYDGFINVIVDDWRGFRFIFDTEDARTCFNDCQNCPLYNLVKDESEDFFSVGLYKASEEDRRFFGPQNFLNCKTLEQYKNCFIQFLLKKAQTQEEIEEELDLIFNLEIIYSKNNNPKKIQEEFRKDILQKVLEKIDARRRKIIIDYLQTK